MLEKETGLGSRATRYGGRVGRAYDDDSVVDNDDEKSSTEEVTKSKKKKKPKTTSSSRTKSTTTIPKRRMKRQHLVNSPMLSLDNAMNDNEAILWLNRVRNLLFKEEKMTDATTTASSNVAINNDDTSDDTSDNTNTTPTSKMTTRTIQILAEPKIDGLGLSLRYRLVDATTTTTTTTDDNVNNYIYQFVWGATRGDGTKGEDVTEAVRSAWMMMMGGEGHNHNNICLPQSLAIPKTWNSVDGVEQQPPDELEIRGEVVLPKKAFDDLFLNSGTVVNDADNNDSTSSSSSSSTKLTFSNARNAASGILLRSKDTDDLAEAEQTQFLRSQLQFYAYDFVASTSIEENDVNLTSIIGNDGIEMRDKLTSLGFCVPSPVVLESLNVTTGVEIFLCIIAI
jgi:NAD-dependent DNA ligase